MSSAVKGSYRREEALRLLLAGTGLVLQPIASDAFVLAENGTAAPQGVPAAPTAEALPAAAARAYDGLVQARIRDALCTARAAGQALRAAGAAALARPAAGPSGAVEVLGQMALSPAQMALTETERRNLLRP